MRLKNLGFSTAELLIALAVTSLAGLGAAYFLGNLEKSKQHLSVQTNYLAVEKSIEGYLISPRGCEALKNVTIGGDVSFKKDPRSTQTFAGGQTVGDVLIDSLKVISFTSLDAETSSGIAQVELKMSKKGSTRGAKRLIPVSVNVIGNVVQACNYTQSQALNALKDEICANTYNMPINMTCDEVIAALENEAVQEICTEVYGAQTAQTSMSGMNVLCDFTKIHANKTCGAGFVQGFKADGSLECRNVSFPSPPSCTTWTVWSPDPATQCNGQPFTQTRTCTTSGVTATQTNPAAVGTRPTTYTWSPGPQNSVCPSQTVTRTDDCTGAQQVFTGTSTDPSCTACTPNWQLSQNPVDVCTTDQVVETDGCGASRPSGIPGQKDCSAQPRVLCWGSNYTNCDTAGACPGVGATTTSRCGPGPLGGTSRQLTCIEVASLTDPACVTQRTARTGTTCFCSGMRRYQYLGCTGSSTQLQRSSYVYDLGAPAPFMSSCGSVCDGNGTLYTSCVVR